MTQKTANFDGANCNAAAALDNAEVAAPSKGEHFTAAEWQKALLKYPEANFLQSPAWGKVNDLVGHKVIVEYNLGDERKPNQTHGIPAELELDKNEPESTYEASQESDAPQYWCQMIVKNAKRGRYLEVPGGPLVDWGDEAAKQAVFAKIKAVAEREKCVFVRIRPQLKISEREKLQGLKLRKAPMHLHAEHTIILDLTKSEDELLSEMRRQTRYEVRRAAKLGLKVDYSNDEKLFREFHQVQAETAARQHFVPPDLKMLLAERTAFGENARLYIARTDTGKPVAYGLILLDGGEAAYFEAASTELNYKLPGAYALQWQVMRDLKALGIKRYNLWGIAPPGQSEHRYAKVTTFKKGFGGEMVEFVPAQDLILKQARYQMDYLVETIRRKRRKL